MASITTLEADTLTTRAPSAPLALELDLAQYELGEGPCVEAAVGGTFVYASRTTGDDRWPAFSARAAARGIASVVSCRLAVSAEPGRALGSINLYSRRPDGFGGPDRSLAMLFAAHAAVVLDASRRQAQLSEAVESRDVIGQAKGILMSQTNATVEEAFDQLRRASQRLNVKLRDVARQTPSRWSRTVPPADGPFP